jgi:UDP-2,4-diacetamido-2,4,6-trideoxy-beta-L-altropyranose hydrolase
MFYFRVDIGPKHGMGHFTRAMAIIKYCKIKSYKVVIDKFYDNNFLKNDSKIICLYDKEKFFKSEKVDSKLFSSLISKKKDAVVVVDSYRLSYEWEKFVSKSCKKIITIDDFTSRRHYSDFYINHSPIFSDKESIDFSNLKKFNKKNCKFLLGPNYALFNNSLDKTKIKSDVVFYNGGSGSPLIYEKVLRLISKKNLKLIVILGPFVPNRERIIIKLSKIKKIKLIENPKNLSSILKGTKLFVSSAGTSMFEASFFKVPSLLFRMNTNQNLDHYNLEKIGHFFSLEKSDIKFTKKISSLLLLMLLNLNDIKKMMNTSFLRKNAISYNYQKKLKNYL